MGFILHWTILVMILWILSSPIYHNHVERSGLHILVHVCHIDCLQVCYPEFYRDCL